MVFDEAIRLSLQHQDTTRHNEGLYSLGAGMLVLVPHAQIDEQAAPIAARVLLGAGGAILVVANELRDAGATLALPAAR